MLRGHVHEIVMITATHAIAAMSSDSSSDHKMSKPYEFLIENQPHNPANAIENFIACVDGFSRGKRQGTRKRMEESELVTERRNRFVEYNF